MPICLNHKKQFNCNKECSGSRRKIDYTCTCIDCDIKSPMKRDIEGYMTYLGNCFSKETIMNRIDSINVADKL